MQYISYLVVKDKIFGLNTIINYKNQARCTFTELIVKDRKEESQKISKIPVSDKNRIDMKDVFEFNEDIPHEDINKEIDQKYRLVLKALFKLEDKDNEVETFYRYSRAEECRLEYLAMMEEEKSGNNAPGIDEVILNETVKHDIVQVIDFINKNERYVDIGVKVPRGFLLYGPAGTGKTLIAKAISKECNCNFEHYSGAAFCNKYVGVAANKIKEMFAKARENAPTILFIDELDALCMSRKEDTNGEDLKALTQLLTEMDGMNDNTGVFVIGATNQLELLDDAVLREGRFDRKIEIKEPNEENRIKMFELYIGKLKHEDDIDIQLYAKMTDGCNGAKIAGICNEAGILAVDRDKTKVSHDEFMVTIEKMMSFNKRHRVEENKRVIGFGV